MGCVERTPRVDWTVSAAIQAVPKSPCAAKTIKSAVTPAPDEGSKPAMVRTVGMGRRGGKSRKSTGLGKNLHFSQDRAYWEASNLYGRKAATLGVLFTIGTVVLLYHKKACFCNCLQPIRSYRCLTWIDYAMTITEGACE